MRYILQLAALLIFIWLILCSIAFGPSGWLMPAHAQSTFSCDEEGCAGTSRHGAWATETPRYYVAPQQNYYIVVPQPRHQVPPGYDPDTGLCYDLDVC